MTRRRGRRRKKLLDDLKDRRGYSHLKEETLDRIMCRNVLRGGFGPVVRQNTEWMKFINDSPPIVAPSTAALLTLTPCSRVLLEKLIGSQLVKKFPEFYGSRRFIMAFTRARHLFLS